MSWMTSPLSLGLAWMFGMLCYAVAYYHTESASKQLGISFISWLAKLDVLSTKIIGFGVCGCWIHSYSNPTLKWLDNIMPRRPFAAFVFGFFCDVIALKVRNLIKEKLGTDIIPPINGEQDAKVPGR